MDKNYLIIGSGVAAVNAAKAIRDHDKEAKIIIFGEENSLPYNRIKLSKELFTNLNSEKNLIKKEKWFKKNNIITHPNTKIVKIDTDRDEVMTATGEVIAFDRLLICTGSKNRKLPIDGADKNGVFTIRAIDEADDFKTYIENKNHIFSIGGGVQGLETAWAIAKTGKKVSIAEVSSRLMARQLDEKTSELLKSKIEAEGVEVHLNTSIDRIVGDNDVEGIVLGNETINCDSVIYSIGVVPDIALVENSAITTNRGIVVDEYMKTSVEGIYAAGDVAELNGEVEGLWGRAMDQGKVAGANMVNTTEAYKKSIPVTIFNAFNLELFSIGFVDELQCDMTVIEDDGNEKYTKVFIKDKKIVGVISLEGIVASTPYRLAIENKISLNGINLKNVSASALMQEVKERQNVVV